MSNLVDIGGYASNKMLIAKKFFDWAFDNMWGAPDVMNSEMDAVLLLDVLREKNHVSIGAEPGGYIVEIVPHGQVADAIAGKAARFRHALYAAAVHLASREDQKEAETKKE